MINSDDATKENIREYNPNWQIPDHPYGMLIVQGSRCGKTNSVFNVITHQSVTEKVYLKIRMKQNISIFN